MFVFPNTLLTAYFLRWSASELPRVWANMSKSSGFRQETEARALPTLSVPTSGGGEKEAEADEMMQNSDVRVCVGAVYMDTSCLQHMLSWSMDCISA